MWASREHGMTYDRKTTGKKDNRIMWASRAHGMTYDRTERQQIRWTTDQKDNKTEIQQDRKTTGQIDNRTERQQNYVGK